MDSKRLAELNRLQKLYLDLLNKPLGMLPPPIRKSQLDAIAHKMDKIDKGEEWALSN